MSFDQGENAPAAGVIDMTELAVAIAMLNDEEPPSGAVSAPASLFPFSEQIKREEAEAAEKEAHTEVGQEMKDGTFYLGRFKGENGIVKDWFAAAEDVKDETGRKLLLDFNEAAVHADASTIHDHNDWIVPPGIEHPDGEPDILNEIFNNRAKIGGFTEVVDSGGLAGMYWSSSSRFGDGDYVGMLQQFDDGYQCSESEGG